MLHSLEFRVRLYPISLFVSDTFPSYQIRIVHPFFGLVANLSPLEK
jgi:hypothetical protein